ncbi:ATP-grasp domain-containing protein [Faecalicatena contorta]|uniref:ATP-grasp domain-containing protein n=1 Tax=Faecalicatena contorta TaxID=39482 RepID=UPI0032180263
MTKVLILGTGNAQIDAIEYCKQNGYYVYGCSYIDTDGGVNLCNEFQKINIIDVDKVAEYAQKNQVDLVYSVGSDIAMPTVNKVSELLNLPHFISSQTADICNNKFKMRKMLSSLEYGCVNFDIVENIHELDFINNKYPKIMKPVDSQGQRGVFKVNTLEEAKENFEKSMSYSRDKKVILEDYLDGPEVSVNGYLVNGELIFSLVSDRISFSEYPGGIIKEHIVPTGFSNAVASKCSALTADAAHELKITNGPIYVQMKIVDEQPYIIEVTPRLDGCHMWRLIKQYCRVDLLDMSFQHLINNALVKFSPSPCNDKLVLRFICQAPNSLFEGKADEQAMYSRCYYDMGDKVRELNGYMEKCGYTIKKL